MGLPEHLEMALVITSDAQQTPQGLVQRVQLAQLVQLVYLVHPVYLVHLALEVVR